MQVRVWLILGITGLNICLPGEDTAWEQHLIAGQKLRAQGLYQASEKEYQAAIQQAENFDPEDPRLARTWNNMATLYQDEVRYTEAERFFLRAASVWERRFGPESLDLAICLNNLATLYQEQ